MEYYYFLAGKEKTSSLMEGLSHTIIIPGMIALFVPMIKDLFYKYYLDHNNFVYSAISYVGTILLFLYLVYKLMCDYRKDNFEKMFYKDMKDIVKNISDKS